MLNFPPDYLLPSTIISESTTMGSLIDPKWEGVDVVSSVL